MCLSKAYLDSNGKRELVMAEVASIKVEGDKLRLRTLFGEEKEVGASIREIDLLGHSILLVDRKKG